MNSTRRHSSDYDDGFDATDWDVFGADTDDGNTRNDRYSNAYGEYRGGYGPMNSASNRDGFGPINNFGYGPPNLVSYPPNLMGQGPFGPGPRPWYNQEDYYMMGRGYGPQGPVRPRRYNDKAMKFLLKCGVPKENLRNLPKALLELMTEESCGLCGLTFNAYSMARIHYVSKNHYKNNKKWLTQHSEVGLQNNAEVPFKARELYCELCDVHITSTLHAKSHYAGKPHRAVVDGRKMPRNPILLQEHMASRLEQLIRREKKSLKAVEDENGKAEETAKNSKLVQSELYCQICKTSVTCSEQMTRHLNGKRHLAKEKQHILRMMKGESKDDGKEKSNKNGAEGDKVGCDESDGEDAGDDVEEGSGVVDDQQGDNQKGEEGDWGNGSGDWDEPETK
ncbi:PREDICTED: uncharacterized protein LOC106117138 [Papilio xuthus]|uniref:Uncharacterized protein LOC106117138 n=1 Tax=Papilio xuthus TaxID=66420 RepID=A0AAJ6Z7E4_PAPXU|nr:PREDICTED: uncharacterized protein LOC106117138 [Papilio xuthus]